jgi:hypothetical protein
VGTVAGGETCKVCLLNRLSLIASASGSSVIKQDTRSDTEGWN